MTVKTDQIWKGRTTALDVLSQLDFEAKRKEYPSLPAHAITARRFNDRTANGLTACILHWLKLKGNYAVRINTTGRRLPDQVVTDVLGHRKTLPGKFIPGTTRIGTADIHAIIGGRHVSIEVKAGADKISPAQHDTATSVQDAGGLFYIARSFEGFYNWYLQTFEK